MDASSLKDKIKEIQDLYQSDDRPWIIGYSGGKDSTCVLQHYMAISKLRGNSKKRCLGYFGDTLVEIPTVVERIDKFLIN